MPVLASTSVSAVTDLATYLAQQIADGRAGRADRSVIGAKDVAFGWTQGSPPIVARFVNAVATDALSFTAVSVKASATPVKKVTEGSAKPTAVALTSADHPLYKYAGLATYSTERAISTDGLIPVVTQVLINGALLAYDADCIAALAAAGGPAVSGATWTSAILNAIAAVTSAGLLPDLLVLSGSDYAAAVETPGSGFMLDPREGVGTLFGLRIIVSAAATTGTGFVLSSGAALAVEHSLSPAVMVDPYSGLGTNEIRSAAELFAAFVVTNAQGVATVSLTGP